VGAAADSPDFADGGLDSPRVDQPEDGGADEDGLEVVVDSGEIDEDRTAGPGEGSDPCGPLPAWTAGGRIPRRQVSELLPEVRW